MKEINQAPEIFRRRLSALKERGMLDDPKFKRAVLDAAKKVVAEMKGTRAEKPVQNPPSTPRE
jgi:hypothetical protein